MLPISIFIYNNTQEINKDEISNDEVENNNLDDTTERSLQTNQPKCKSARYEPEFWRRNNTLSEIMKFLNKPLSDVIMKT